jgi:predicted transcriptional regulator
MLLALLEGRMLPASDLARAANLSAQAASNHLARMLDGGVLRVESRGRYRYYALADSNMAHAIEALACAAHGSDVLRPTLRPKGDAELRLARTCYRHLAGQLGTQLCQAMQAHGYLLPQAGNHFALSASGADWLRQALGIDAASLQAGGREQAKACLDWSERRDHLAGVLGEAICSAFLARELVTRRTGRRSLLITEQGRQFLQQQLGLQL